MAEEEKKGIIFSFEAGFAFSFVGRGGGDEKLLRDMAARKVVVSIERGGKSLSEAVYMDAHARHAEQSEMDAGWLSAFHSPSGVRREQVATGLGLARRNSVGTRLVTLGVGNY
ncbi:hypothetical protein ACLOJK_032176 [Asimina triloba]